MRVSENIKAKKDRKEGETKRNEKMENAIQTVEDNEMNAGNDSE